MVDANKPTSTCGLNLKAVRILRKMRGRSQAHLIEADDRCAYVVKFRNNPEHRRILINEWIASGLIRWLSIMTPRTAVIELSPEFVDANPDVYMSDRTGAKVRPVAGKHFGSQYAGDPDRVAVYDLLPRPFLRDLANGSDFVGMLVLDVWLSNIDDRQAAFCRRRQRSSDFPGRLAVIMIDHGNCFSGGDWRLQTDRLVPLYHDRTVYEPSWTEENLDFWLARLDEVPQGLLSDLAVSVPAEWFDRDREALERLLAGLWDRRTAVRDLVRTVITHGFLPPPKRVRVPVRRVTSCLQNKRLPSGFRTGSALVQSIE